MTTEDFVKLTAECRAAQKKYFKTRSYDVLNRARDLERKLDKAIVEMQQTHTQGLLFE